MIFFFKDSTRYTFNKSDYETKYVFLKRLEGGKIQYDNQIYDKDFFDYQKLKKYTKIFYIYQKKYIDSEFNKILMRYKMSKSLMSESQRRLEYPKVKYYKSKSKIIHNLTKEQYDILVNAFTFNFSYGHFSTKKLSYYLYRFGWFSIKPVYTMFQEPLFAKYNFFDNYEPDYDPHMEGSWDLNRTNNLRKVGFFEQFKEAWDDGQKAKYDEIMYESEEKDEKKREFYLHVKQKYKYSSDPIKQQQYWDVFYSSIGEKLEYVDQPYECYDLEGVLKSRDVYDIRLDYDPQRKYNEYDFYSKTNTRYARYITYNEVYYKDYKGKKFPTENYFTDYTEEEIKFNFNNMINNKGPKKYEECISLYKNVKYMKEFLDILNDQYTIRLNELVRGYKYCRSWGTLIDWTYNDRLFIKKSEEILQRLLYDPRYILIMPVLDAYFEMYRYDYTDKERDAEIKWEYHYVEHEFSPEETMCAALYVRTLEYKEFISVQEPGHDWWFADCEDQQEENSDWHEREYVVLFLSICIFLGLIYYTSLYLGYFLPLNEFPSTLQGPTNRINEIHAAHMEYLQNRRPKVYFELANRKPHYLKRQLPPKFYLNEYYSYKKHEGRGNLPYNLIDLIKVKIDAKDFSLRGVHMSLWRFGKKLGYPG